MRIPALSVMEGCGRVRARASSSCAAVIRSFEKFEQLITLLPSEGEPSLFEVGQHALSFGFTTSLAITSTARGKGV